MKGKASYSLNHSKISVLWRRTNGKIFIYLYIMIFTSYSVISKSGLSSWQTLAGQEALELRQEFIINFCSRSISWMDLCCVNFRTVSVQLTRISGQNFWTRSLHYTASGGATQKVIVFLYSDRDEYDISGSITYTTEIYFHETFWPTTLIYSASFTKRKDTQVVTTTTAGENNQVVTTTTAGEGNSDGNDHHNWGGKLRW